METNYSDCTQKIRFKECEEVATTIERKHANDTHRQAYINTPKLYQFYKKNTYSN